MDNCGLETVLKLYNPSNRNERAVIILHWSLIKHGFKFTGLNDENPTPPTEILPSQWNSNSAFYKLVYKFNEKAYNLLCTVVGETLMCNFLDLTDQGDIKTYTISIDKKELAINDNDDFGTSLPKYEKLLENFKVNILKSVIPEEPAATSKSDDEKKKEQQNQRDPLRVDPLIDNRGRYEPRPQMPFFIDPDRNIGGGDLNPFGIGGGMLFNPNQPRHPIGPDRFHNFGGLARYDPTTPPGYPNSLARPRPDFDNMFS